jgi:hypothetical protein
LKKIETMNQLGDKKVIRTWSRASTIFPQMVGPRSRCMMPPPRSDHITENMVGQAGRIRADPHVSRSLH